MKTNCWLTISLAFYVAGSASGFAAHSASATSHPKKTAHTAAAAKPSSAPKASSTSASALQTGPAEVMQEHVNVRAQADVDSEVVSRLSRNDVVKVIEEVTVKKAGPGEPSRWAKIAWPASAPVWVYADFVDKTSMQVKVAKLNLRTGPGENHSVVGHLDKGATLKKLEAKGDWIKVEAPDTCVAFVAASLLQSKSAAAESPTTTAAHSSVPATGLRPATPASPRPTPPPLPATTTTDVQRDILVSQPKSAPVPTFTLPPPQPPRPSPAPATFAGISPAVTPPVLVPPPTTKPAPTTPAPAPLVSTSETKPAPALTREPGEIDFHPQREETYIKRIVTREGLVCRSYNIQAPTSLVLENTHNGRVMNYLYSTSTNMNLNAYRGRVVTVTGEEALDERWPNVPVIRVETLQTDP